MAERLIIVSDMWGAKQGLWITSYLAYLQQYFDITYYDCQQLANLEILVQSEENLHRAFEKEGINTAVAHLLKKEKEPAHYLCFSMGGVIAWKAGLMGLPMKSLYTVSSTRIRSEVSKPNCTIEMLFGDTDIYRPKSTWFKEMDLEAKLIKDFGHTMYIDEKIVRKVCMDLLEMVMQKPTKTIKGKEKAI